MSRCSALFVALMFPALVPAGAAQAQPAALAGRLTPDIRHLGNAAFLDATHLLALRQGSHLSQLARNLGNGGFETAAGSRVDFRPWYASRWTDAGATWMTLVSPNLGLIHGLSTGERGEKYTIAPALTLGLMMQAQTGRRAFLTFRATTTLGGDLREKPCTADYGEIGGVQAVNCRLAATTLQPAQTLDYLVREKPYNRNQASLVFQWQF